MNLLEWLTELGLPVSLLDQRFIMKGYNSGKTDVGDTGRGVWGDTGASMTPPGDEPLPSTSTCSTQKPSKPHPFRVL